MTRRLPQIAFGCLALATIGAFFVVQTLKTKAPVFWTTPSPIPAAISPIIGRSCVSRPTKAHPYGVALNYRYATLKLSVTHADTVGVYIVNADNPTGNTIDTVSSGTPMRAAKFAGEYPRVFRWNGRLTGGQPAPDGRYFFRIVLEHEDHSVNLSQRPVQVINEPPVVRVLSVRLLGGGPIGTGTGTGTTGTGTAAATVTTSAGTSTVAASGKLVPLPGPVVLSPPQGHVQISFSPHRYRSVVIDIYRTDVAGRPELVDPLTVNHPDRGRTTWNGEIAGAPAPAGTYLIGIRATDLACNSAQWPPMSPAPGSTAGAGVTVRYLSVTPPLTPTSSGARARVAIDSAAAAFTWSLRRPGAGKVLAHGSGAAGRSTIRVPMPRRQTGLYTLTINAGTQSAAVPLVASQRGVAAAHARVLVVLPMLTWMGDTPVDDSGDGLPDTLRAGDAVALMRPLVDGPPAGFGGDAKLLAYLAAHGLSYQLTTDVALAEGVGPSLADRGGVIFGESEQFLPAGLELTLRGFVRAGGRVLVLGTGALSATSHISGFPAAPGAGAPRATPTDLFGARRGQLTPTGGELISSVSDDALALFGNAGEFGGFGQYQPISPPADAASGTVSAIGIGSAAPAIVAFHYGSGTVVEVGLSGFAASLAHNADAASLLNNVWQLLSQ
ncbi:MAG TPA: N,N-dimethylformamidase beta subunit family domain-containing protein [Solirubrobacteraceae bacterium]|nr:N,N-dimethylformamidase beta subunit family domain-containing protein [Solirubrobacteraceae bacterium]